MSERLVSTLTVGFDADDKNDGLGDKAGQNKIILQQMTTRFDSFGQLWARCFPSSGVQFTASVGTVTPGEVRSQRVSESVKFSNSSSATLKFPNATNVSIDTLNSVIMKKIKDNEGKTRIVRTTEVSFRFDAESASIKTEDVNSNPIAVYGSCFVRYDALYQMLYYKPGSVVIPVGGTDYAMTVYTGDIYGWNDYDVAIQPMDLDMSSPASWVEYARVTSKIVLDAKGVWEFPPNWEGTYQRNKEKVGENREDYSEPGKFGGSSEEIDQDNSFVDTRVHCIIEVNTMGTLRYSDHNNGGAGYWAWYAPYFASGVWSPKYEVKFADAPGGKKASSAEDFKYDLDSKTWRDVFLSVSKAKVMDRLREEYPGVTES